VTAWLIGTAAWDVYLSRAGRQTLSQWMRSHPALTALGLVALVAHVKDVH
jgi:hypothetical protein